MPEGQLLSVLCVPWRGMKASSWAGQQAIEWRACAPSSLRLPSQPLAALISHSALPFASSPIPPSVCHPALPCCLQEIRRVWLGMLSQCDAGLGQKLAAKLQAAAAL